MEFQTGDLVRLKSGGPIMTVDSVGEGAYDPRPHVWCIWFERVGSKNTAQRETFPMAAVEKYEKPPSTTYASVAF